MQQKNNKHEKASKTRALTKIVEDFKPYVTRCLVINRRIKALKVLIPSSMARSMSSIKFSDEPRTIMTFVVFLYE
uniref:Uncharacterized protein n=1 Tax=Romanomermis culicivorax TaxID=13658 RepID=A0A915L4P3_ROMCU